MYLDAFNGLPWHQLWFISLKFEVHYPDQLLQKKATQIAWLPFLID